MLLGTKAFLRLRGGAQKVASLSRAFGVSGERRGFASKKGGGKKTSDPDVALSGALHDIEQQFGKGSIMQLGDSAAARNDIPVISTGSLGLDLALGCGGLPRGRVVELYGPESSGKTSLALHVIAEAQKNGGKCTFIDAEHALDPAYARNLGVNIDELFVSQPDCGEDALEIADTLVGTGAMDVVVIDSVAALVPKLELEGEMGDSHVALQARLMSQALRKLTGKLHSSNTLLIFINQLRSKVGVIFGSPEVTAGGNALKFYASVRMDIRRRKQIKGVDPGTGNKTFVGSHTRVKIVKNKMAPPFKEVEFDLMYGKGICKTGELVDIGIQCGALQQSGAWISMADSGSVGEREEAKPLAQGREKAKMYLDNHPEFRTILEAKINKAITDAKLVAPGGGASSELVEELAEECEAS